MQEEAQSGEEDINVEDDSIKKDAAPRSFTGAAAKRLEEETVVRAEPPKATPPKAVSEEGNEAICEVVIEIIGNVPFMKIVPVAAHVHDDHVDKEVVEVIGGKAIAPIAEIIGVGPCKELLEAHKHQNHQPVLRQSGYSP